MEIKTSELRLGNKVFLFNEVATISSIRCDRHIEHDEYYDNNPMGYGEYYSIKHVKPIPLTEEWLLKMNAEEIVSFNDGYKRFNIDGIHLSISNERDFFVEYVHQIPMKFVHTFQNYYFAVKQQELTIK